MNVVVDTNVVAYYWLPGAHTEQAVALRRRCDDWFVPKLWRSEFCSVLGQYLRAGSIGLDQARALIRSVEAELVDSERESDLGMVMDLVAASTCSAYDCEFVALARSMGIPLVTEDAQVLRDFPENAINMMGALSRP